ncbi:MAG: hypothetical protein ABW217_12680, partial [Polyangiaceae bacterium]
MQRRVMLSSVCASLLVLACSSGSDEQSAPAEQAPPREPVTNDDDTPVDVAPPLAADPEPAAPADDDDEPAPAEPPATARVCDDSVSFDDLYTLVAADLRDEGDDGVFLRYVSLGNRLNQGICSEDLASDRFAVIKAVNSLSIESRIAVPEAIDAEETVYRIDLRSYGWDRPTTVGGVDFADKWEAILDATPLAVEFEGDEADEAKLRSGTTVPVIYADSLLNAAMVDELYYALIEVGEDEDALLAQLGIDEEDQEERKIVVKAGTSQSEFSRQDMVAERLEIELYQGYYWGRYDIAADTAGQSIFADPLEFEKDSIAAVFSLPNGLNGYALFDGAGVRVNDTNVVLDPAQRDDRVRNSVSCSQCHASGLNAISDEIRGYAEANPLDYGVDVLDEVLDAFPEQSTIDDAFAQDTQRYRDALSRLGLPASGSDPISVTYLRYDGDVSLEIAAGELGVTPERFERDLTQLSAEVDPALSTLRSQ